MRKTYIGLIILIALIGLYAFVRTDYTVIENWGKQAYYMLVDRNFSSAFTDTNNRYVASIRNSYLSRYSTDTTIGEAFEGFFSNPRWSYFRADSGEDVVEFRGGMNYRDEPVTARVQFVFEDDGERFSVGAVSFNDIQQNNLMVMGMLSAIYENVR